MQIETFHIKSYLRPGDASHVAHKDLAQRWPDKAHNHDYFEVFLVERGSTEHWINRTRERCHPGHLAFVRPGDAHAFRADAETGCRIFNVMVRRSSIDHLLARYPQEFAGRLFDSPGPAPEAHLMRDAGLAAALKLTRGLTESTLSLAQVEGYLLALATQILAPSVAEPAQMPPWLARACAEIRTPERFRQGTAGFVAAAGRSHEHLCRACRTFLGTTPSAYVNRVRSAHAAERLLRTTLPISDIAADVGLENLSHFYRVFRHHFGTTPKDYRRTHQKDPFE